MPRRRLSSAVPALAASGHTVTSTEHQHGSWVEPDINPDSVWFVDGHVTYSGHATVRGNFNLNERNSNQTFTQTIHLTGSDGSSLSLHETSHITYNGNGIITVSFDKLSIS